MRELVYSLSGDNNPVPPLWSITPRLKFSSSEVSPYEILSGELPNIMCLLNPFRAVDLFQYFLKTSESLWLSDVFKTAFHNILKI